MSDLDYRKLLDAFEDAVVLGDRSGSIVYANPAVGKLLGWTREELIGRPLTLLIPHKLRSRHTAGFNRARSTRQHRVLGKPLRVPVLQANGMELSAEMVLSAFRGGAGEELFIATFRRASSTYFEERAPAARYLYGLGAIAAELPAGNDPVELVRRLEVLVSAHLGACGVRLWLTASPEELRLVNRRPIAELEEPENGRLSYASAGSLPALAARNRRLMVQARQELDAASQWLDQHGVACTVAAPLLYEGELLGVLHLLSGESWSEDLAQAVSLLGGLVASALGENRRRELEKQQRLAAELGEVLILLTGKMAALSAGACGEALLEEILEWSIRLTGADEGSLVLRNAKTGECVIRACAGYKAAVMGMAIPGGMGMTSLVLESGEAVIVPDYQQFERALPRIRQRGVRCALGAPLRGSNGVVGVLTLGSRRRDRQFSEADLRGAEALANLASLALSR